MKLNEVDQEILEILKRTFLTRGIKPLGSDDHLRLWMLRGLLYTSLFGLISRIILGILDKDVSGLSQIISAPIALFFGVLFIHINNEVENTSIIIFVLTWLSIVLALYA